MFDHTHVHQHSISSAVAVTKHEHRAPTDESVKLLREMEAAARANILKSTPLEANGFKFVVHHVLSHVDWQHIFLLQYELNGKRREVRVTVNAEGTEQQVLERSVQEIHNQLAADLASHMLAGGTITRNILRT